MAALPIDPVLYDLEAEPLMPRPAGGPVPVGAPDFGYEEERAPYLPYREPSAATRFLAPFAGLQMQRGSPPLALLLGGLLQGLGQRRVQEHQRGEQERQELNRRYGLAASERNRANLAASGRAFNARIAEKKAESARIESEKDARDPRLTIGHALQLGLPPARAGRRVSELPPAEQNKLPPETVKEAKRFDIRASLDSDPGYKSALRGEENARNAATQAEVDPNSFAPYRTAFEKVNEAIKRHVAGKVRAAKTRQEANEILDEAFAQYPELQKSPMIVTVARDKVKQFGAQR